jgi:bla regulator protein blaR1
MNLVESFFSQDFIRAFAWTLLHSLWQGVLIAILAAVLMWLLRAYRPAVRYMVLYTLMGLMPLLFVLTFFFVEQTGNEVLNPVKQPVINTFQENFLNQVASVYAGENANPDTWYSIPVHFVENHANWLVMIWFIGFLVFLIRFSGSLFFVYRLKHERLYPVDAQWESRLKILSGAIGLNQNIKLAESALAKIPMTIGYLKPVILLPVGTLSGVPPMQLEAIILHELAHILRRDYLLNIIQSVIEMLFFYHPVTWWLSSLIRQEREHICDDIAIGINHDQINYIKALTTMEEFNAKSPVMANAITGTRKKLLTRVKRLIMPAKVRKSGGEGIIAFLLLICLVFALSFNALSIIPDSFDLSGRESGERLNNLLPFSSVPVSNPGSASSETTESSVIQTELIVPPDTIIATSKSGKVVIQVYTDSIDGTDEKDVQVIVERLDDQLDHMQGARAHYNKEVEIWKSGADQIDSISKIVIIKTGDSIKVIKQDTVFMLPDGYDTSFSTSGGFQFYGFEAPEIPDFPEFPPMPDMKYYYFDDGQIEAADEFERAIREQERDMKEFQWQQQDMERELDDNFIIVEPGEDIKHEWKWQERSPEPGVNPSERIIRQELRDDGLTTFGKKYVVELNAKSMFINGEKQPKDVYKKYRKLIESLDQMSFDSDETYKLIF